MTTSRKLVTYVHVDGQVYGPDSDVPTDVAKQITNPKAWGETEANGGDAATSYSDQKVDDIKAEIDKRNEGREDVAKISKHGNKADLVAALEADDAASA